ncbi:MAG: MarR family winged helix-turn-helix transcriptional regulator [Brevirhabdus sp.]
MTSETGFVLDDFLPYQLSVLASRVSRDYAKLYQQRFDISIPEWRVVAHLSQSGAVSVREIHEKVDMDKSKVSRAATRLETRGFITKQTNPGDRRLVELALTDKGRAMIDELAPLARQFEAEVMAQLEDCAEPFRKAVRKLLASDATS